MRKYLLLAILLAGCGGDGPGDSVAPSVSNGTLDFSGTYSLRDHNCTGNPIAEFVIVDTGETNVSITVSDSGDNAFLQKGDQFNAPVIEYKGIPLIDASSKVGCIAGFVENEKTAEAATQINVDKSDLITVCTDNSADGKCSASYQHDK
ncbi:MAG: hypothetical protein Q7S98_05195 [Deltaproteobacteria bacterium]|nr:hypothetical protein [Deltaproteobacteria bacterium]